MASELKSETVQETTPVEKFSYETLNGWLVTEGVCLFFICSLYKKMTQSNWE